MSTLDDIKARIEKATLGPWSAEPYLFGEEGRVRVTSPSDSEDYNTAEDVLTADAEFIAHARTDVPKLVAALEAVERLAEEWRLAFREDASDTNDIWDDAARKIEQAIAEALA